MSTSPTLSNQPAPRAGGVLPGPEEDTHHQPDRLSFTLFLAAAIHAVVILGVSFVPSLSETRTPAALDVILVQQSTSEPDKPEKADYLSNAAKDGGGDVDENSTPSAPFTSELDENTDGVAPTPVEASRPEAAEQVPEQVLTTVFSSREVNSDTPDTETKPVEAAEADVLVEHDLMVASLEAEIAREKEEYAKRPRIKTVNARTHESAAADYMYNWAENIERVGGLNYPEQARARNLTGAVLLVVGIYKSGHVESVEIRRSSGVPLIDDAAKHIVRLASPFSPLSPALARETDILYIIRTWEFGSNTLKSY